MGFLKKYYKKYYKMFFLAIFFISLETFADLLQPTLMSALVDQGILRQDMDFVMRQGLLMVFVTFCGAVFASIRNVISSNVALAFSMELRHDIYEKIQSFTMKDMDRFSRASLVTRMTNDVNQMQTFINGLMRIFVKAPLIFIGSLIMAARLNMKLASVILYVLPVVILIMVLNVRIGYPLFRTVQEKLDRVNDRMREYLSGVRVVKAFNSFVREDLLFRKVNEDLSDRSEKAMRTTSFFNPLIAIVLNLSLGIILYLGGYFHQSGEILPGQVMAFVNYMGQLLFSITMIGNIFNMLVRAKASHERIDEIFAIPGSEEPGNLPIKDRTEVLEFEDVSFSYPEGSGLNALKDISFRVEKGETLGIIGSTGSGKSTIANLILRFYDVTEGEIRFNGTNIREIRKGDLREKVSIVPQKPVLFTGTIIDNIRWGRKDAEMEKVEEALKVADAYDFSMSFNNGLETLVGQGGMNFSGGQKQRLSIARALVRDPEVLILDDSLSKVDVETEQRIRNGLLQKNHDIIVVLISQRITSVMDCNRILVLDKGEVRGYGTHEELMGTSSEYREIFRSQIGEVSDGER
ncbi:MAG TPA: ABC transporter ATP-binding protein [Clostridiaceae bacterium]|nr:ABC transporter ATP-binding protein [Clostridiaceae bacterium]